MFIFISSLERVVDFLLVLIELFLLRYAWGHRLKIGVLLQRGQFDPTFQGEGVVPHQPFLVPGNYRINVFSCSIEICTELSFILSQITHGKYGYQCKSCKTLTVTTMGLRILLSSTTGSCLYAIDNYSNLSWSVVRVVDMQCTHSVWLTTACNFLLITARRRTERTICKPVCGLRSTGGMLTTATAGRVDLPQVL